MCSVLFFFNLFTPSVVVIVFHCVYSFILLSYLFILSVFFDRVYIVCEFDVQMTHYGDFILSCPLSNAQFHINSSLLFIIFKIYCFLIILFDYNSQTVKGLYFFK